MIEDDKGMVKMSVTPPILYETKEPGNKSQIVKITKVMGIPTIDVIKDTISMTVKFSFPNNAKVRRVTNLAVTKNCNLQFCN